jgi:hypothetical protein
MSFTERRSVWANQPSTASALAPAEPASTFDLNAANRLSAPNRLEHYDSVTLAVNS